MRPRVAVTHWVHPEVLALLRRSCEVSANPGHETLPRDEVLQMAKDAEGLMAFMPDIIDEEFLRVCPRLKIVAAALKGYDHFDVQAMTRRGIWFTMVPDLLTSPTAELAVTLLLGLTRRVLEGDRWVRSGHFVGWRPELYGTDLRSRIAGIVGMGAIGRALAKRLAGFEMEILYYDRCRLPDYEEINRGLTYVSLDQLLGLSDFVILCVPLDDDTFHLIDPRRLRMMKPKSYLVNVCRGSVVDEDAVANALKTGQLAGYAADVFEMEDLKRANRPCAVNPSLVENESQTLFTPHVGSAVADIRRRIELRAALNILDGLQGKMPRDAVNHPSLASSLSIDLQGRSLKRLC